MKVQIAQQRIIGNVAIADGFYTIEKWSKKRTLPQNKYYWSIVVKMIADETGHSVDDTHAKLCYKFLLVKDGKTPFVRSTTSLKTTEFEEYLESVKRWASSFLSLVIPDPNS